MKISRPLLVVAALVPAAASAAQVWVAGASEKIRPDAQPRTTTQAALAAARNEFESFQIVVTGPASGVSAQASPLASGSGASAGDGARGSDAAASGRSGGASSGAGGAGAAIAAPNLYREDLIDLANPSAADGGTGRWPDALVPDVDDVVGEKRNAFPFDVAAGESRAIWVEYHVPEGTSPGDYHGEVTVSTSDGQATIPVTFTVWNFTLPSTSSLRSYFGMSYGGVLAGHGITMDSDASLRARYAQLALDHRISLGGVADDGTKDDFGRFDQFYGPLVDGTAPTQLKGARLTSVEYVGDGSVDEHRAWAQHARDKGFMDRLFDYTCDEPPLTCSWNDLHGRAQAVHQADSDFRTLVTTQVWDAQSNGVASDIDIIVPIVNWIDDKPGNATSGDQRSRYDSFLSSASAKEMWLYQSCMSHGCGGTVNMGSPSSDDLYFTGWPSYVIDASAVRNRAMEWISFEEGASGELYWETTFAFSHDAWSNEWDFSGNGDGTLFYPGTPSRIGGRTDIPIASIRLKMIREGMEDFEYLKLLADVAGPDEARQMARKLFPAPYSAGDVTPDQLMAARAEIAARIQGGGGGASAGGCESAGGAGGGGLLALPALLALALVRARRRRRAADL